jgi:hypothetical protein
MACNKCASTNQGNFKSEISISFGELENINRSPIYICQDVSVCLECGHLELALPPAKLELLKGTAGEPNSQRGSGQDGTVGS